MILQVNNPVCFFNSHDEALQKAHAEYEKFRVQQLAEPTAVEKHFIEAEQEMKRIEAASNKEKA